MDVRQASKIRSLDGARASGTRERGVKNKGIRERMPALFPLDVEGRAPGFCAARVAILGPENGSSKSPH
jgi:hypothetical protein